MNGRTREVMFEMTRIGNIMRVTAIDAETGAEVVMQGPSSTGVAELQRVAMAKLDYVMRKGGKQAV